MIHTKAIILKYTEYKDDQYIIQLYTDTLGLISISAKVTKRSKLRKAYLFPLSRLVCELEVRPSRSIHTLTQCSVCGDIAPHFEPAKAMLRMFLAEILASTITPSVVESPKFQFIDSTIDALEQRTDIKNLHLVFLIHYTRYLGFFPNISNIANGAYFDLQEGEFIKLPPIHNYYLDLEKSIIFTKLLRASFLNMHVFMLSAEERNQILDHIIEYYTLHVPHFMQPRSLDILRNI